jgi:predicted permease
MHWSALVRRVRALFARDAVEAEMRDELALHLELHIRHLREQGLSPTEARRQALIHFGGIEQVKEAYRDARGVRPLEELMQDFRYAIRSLLRQRVFTATVVLTLAIGIGATTAIYSLVDAAWLSWSRSFEHADRLAVLRKTFPDGRGPTSPFDFRDWRREVRAFDGIAGFVRGGAVLIAGEEPIRISSVAVSSSFFGILGVRPALGRFFREDEEQWGQHRVVVLSHATWQRNFAGAADVVGRTVILDNAPSEIVGVAPRGAWFGANPPAIYAPLSLAPNDPANARHSHFVSVMARVAPGMTLETADAELRGIARRIATVHPENEGTGAEAVALEEVILGDVKPTLRLLIAAAVLLLVIACANVANLLLVRNTTRLRELAVRAALGASARRVAQQLLTESLVLALVGGLAGVAIAAVTVGAIGSAIPAELPRIGDTGVPIDWRVLVLSLAVVIGSGLACGMLPAFQAIRGTLGRGAADMLREGSRSVSGGRRSAMMRSTLVVAQVAVALVLLVSSGLLTRSLLRLQRQSSGVDPTDVISVRLGAQPRTVSADRAIRYWDEAIQRVEELPGVTAAGVSSHLPLTGGGESKSFWVEGRAPTELAAVPSVVGRMESARSLEAMGVTLLHGRWFAESDDESAPYVAILGQSVARRYFPNNEDPLGKRISLHPPEELYPAERLPPGGRWPRFTVVGVVGDVRYGDARDDVEHAVYVHYPQGRRAWPWGPQWLVMKTTLPPATAMTTLRAALRSLDPTLPLTDMLPLADRMGQSLRAPRFTTTLVATFAIVAVVLGVIGLYGVIAYSVAQETRSIGVRLALGATPGRIARLVLQRGARLAMIGIVVGLGGAVAVTRWIESQLFGVSAADPVTYAAGSISLLALAMLASWLPARRAANTDAVTALRAD